MTSGEGEILHYKTPVQVHGKVEEWMGAERDTRKSRGNQVPQVTPRNPTFAQQVAMRAQDDRDAGAPATKLALRKSRI